MLRSNKIISSKNFQLKMLLILFLFSFSKSWGQTTIFSEDMGNVNSGTQTIAGTTFQNNGTLTYIGTADTRTSTPSSGYSTPCAAASGVRNVFFTNSGTASYEISGINTSACASFTLSYGIFKSTTASNGSEFIISVSTDGISYTALTAPSLPTGSGTAIWHTLSISSGIPATSNLRIRFVNTSASTQFRLDDVCLQASCTLCTPPTTTISPATQTICAGSVATISVTSSATSPSYTWQASANGTSGWADVVNGTPSGASYSGANTAVLTTTTASIYYYRCLVAEGGTCTATSSTSTLVVNTISITSQPISVTTNSTGIASYSVTASGSGLSYQWQENTGSGFSNISNGGTNPTYAGATSSVLTIANPPLSMSGYTYQCVVSNACGTVTTNGTSTITVSTALTCPFIQGVLINGCSGSCSAEGNNEFVVMNSGGYSIPVNSTNLNLTYNNGSNINFTSGFTAQPGDITNLNTLAGCNVFVEASTGTIPPNSTFIVMNQGSCFNNGFTDFCSAGTVYVVFSNDADWIPGGFFANSGTSVRSFITNFTSLTSGACGTTTYTYLPDNLQNNDGASISYSSPGGSPSYLNGTGNCSPPITILPIELIDFYAIQDEAKNNLVWKVASESKVSQYIIEKSDDGLNFSELTRVKANNIEGVYQLYSCDDYYPFDEITYYRLSTQESNGKTYHHKIIDIDRSNKDWKSLLYQNDEELILEFKNTIPKNAQLLLFDLSGKLLSEILIEQSSTRVNTTKIAAGIYFAKIETPYKTENFKIIIQNDR